MHIDRDQTPPNADPERTPDNIDLVKKEGTIAKMINQRIAEGYTGKKAIRKDAVKGMAIVLSGSHDDMAAKSRKEILLWAKDNYNFIAKRYGEENMMRCTLHVDEKTPHLHVVIVPLRDGRLQANKIFDREALKTLQTEYAEEMSEHGFERGIDGSPRRHHETAEYYRYITEKEMEAKEVLRHAKAEKLVASLLHEKLPELTQELSKRATIKTKKRHERGI